MSQILDIKVRLSKLKLSSEDSYISISGADEAELNSIFNLLKSAGYKRNQEMDCQPPTLWIRKDSDSWEQVICPLYTSADELWKNFREKSCAPDFYFLFGLGSAPDLDNRLDLYFTWKRVLALLADHEGTRTKPFSLIFFVSTEKGPKKFEINPLINWEEFSKIEYSIESLEIVKKIEVTLNLGDAHSKERYDVMRSSISDFVENASESNSFIKLNTGTLALYKKYLSRYEIYTQKFSVNKILSEIEEKTADYLGKIQDSVSTSQTKAYAIPGALIGIAALVKSSTPEDILLVLIGLIFIWHLTKTANDIHRESYAILSTQISEGFQKYKDQNEDNEEIKIAARIKSQKLSETIDLAVTRLKTIDKAALWMVVISTIYFIPKLFNEEAYELIKACIVLLINWTITFVF